VHPLAFPMSADVAVRQEPFAGDGAHWVMAQAEAELVARYRRLDAGEFGLTADMFEPPAGAFLVARAGNAPLPVGGVGVRTVEPALGEVRRLWVHPAWRGRGIGRALMAALESRARELGQSNLQLGTGNRQPEAVALYEGSGWTRLLVGPDGQPLPDGYVRFHKNLS
jgi:GNAT superfamily N-acetyltransferase